MVKRSLLVVLALTGSPVALGAAGSSAPMTVSVTVARSCTVGGQARTGVTLQCSRGVNQVSVTTAGPLDSVFTIASATTKPPLDIRSLTPRQNIAGALEPRPIPHEEISAFNGTLQVDPAGGPRAAVEPETDRPVVVTFNF